MCKGGADRVTCEQYKAARERLGTQAEVAARLQVSRVTVAKRETGAMVITEEAALALSALAGRGGAGGRKRVAPKRRKAPNEKLSGGALDASELP
jgi:transcriptional regulator with XRE-family HTH domain